MCPFPGKRGLLSSSIHLFRLLTPLRRCPLAPFYTCFLLFSAFSVWSIRRPSSNHLENQEAFLAPPRSMKRPSHTIWSIRRASYPIWSKRKCLEHREAFLAPPGASGSPPAPSGAYEGPPTLSGANERPPLAFGASGGLPRTIWRIRRPSRTIWSTSPPHHHPRTHVRPAD